MGLTKPKRHEGHLGIEKGKRVLARLILVARMAQETDNVAIVVQDSSKFWVALVIGSVGRVT